MLAATVTNIGNVVTELAGETQQIVSAAGMIQSIADAADPGHHPVADQQGG